MISHLASWDPNRIEWLHRRVDNDELVLARDLARIVAADPQLIPDPVLREQVVRACLGKLHGRKGRPKRTTTHRLKLELAALQVDVLTRWYERAKRRGYGYAYDRKRDGGLSLAEHVHEIVARRLKLGSGRSLANALSALKKAPF